MVRKVMIIRHAEKPAEHGGGPIGVTLDGLRDDHDLVPRGWQRAGALATLFAASAQTGTAPIERPDTLVAAGVNAASRSRRAQSTIGPTAEKLALPKAVITAFCPGDEAALARHIHAAAGDVWLICWEHKHIQDIVAEITAGTVRAPHWSGSRFDVIFVLDKGPEGWRLQQVPQLLLAGDLETSVAEKSLTTKDDDA